MSLVFGHPYAQALAWALIHFVWQGAAIALALVLIQRLSRLSASARYTSGVIAMAVMLAAPALTFARLSATSSTIASSEQVASTTAAKTPDGPGSLALVRTDRTPIAGGTAPSLMPSVVLVIWSAGVIVLSLRLFGGWIVARGMARRALSPASAEIQALARRVAGRLALDRVVGVFESSAVAVPVMIGWVKPVVLLPAAAISGLSMVQVEALLAHELAHVQRQDYLVNLLQSVVETLLFYHPAVWFVSRRMRIDREHCCDDLAVHICDRVVYATALSDLAAMTTTPRVALAATDGPLLNRVRRILGQPAEGHDSGSGWISACLVVLLVGSIAPVALTQEKRPDAVTQQVGSVQGGVPGGVAGGVPGGVADGVPGGVPGSVAGGVAGGVASDVQEQEKPKEQTAEQAAAAEKEKLLLQLRALQEELQNLQQAKTENEQRRAETESKARMKSLDTTMKTLLDQRDRMRQMVEKQRASPAQLSDVEAKIAAAEQQMKTEQSELEYRRRDVDLQLKERALERELAARQREVPFEVTPEALEKAKVEEQALEMYKRQAEAKKWLAQQDVDKFALAQQLYEKQGVLALEGAGTALGADDTARGGDVAVIAIRSEPDLPRLYTVQSDGTIRFPFLGSIRVEGQTAKQLEDTLNKQFKDKKLRVSDIQVTLRRPAGR